MHPSSPVTSSGSASASASREDADVALYVNDVCAVEVPTHSTSWPFTRPCYVVTGRQQPGQSPSDPDGRCGPSAAVCVHGFQHYMWLMPRTEALSFGNGVPSLSAMASEMEEYLRAHLTKMVTHRRLHCQHLGDALLNVARANDDHVVVAEALAACRRAASIAPPPDFDDAGGDEWEPCWQCFARSQLGMHIDGPSTLANLRRLQLAGHSLSIDATAIVRVVPMQAHALPTAGYQKNRRDMLRVELARPELARVVGAAVRGMQRHFLKMAEQADDDDDDDDDDDSKRFRKHRRLNGPTAQYDILTSMVDGVMAFNARLAEGTVPYDGCFDTLEMSATGLVRFMVDNSVSSGKWLRASGGVLAGGGGALPVQPLTRCAAEYHVNVGVGTLWTDSAAPAPLRVLSFDIETVVGDEALASGVGGVPQVERGGRLLQVGSIVADVRVGGKTPCDVCQSMLMLDYADPGGSGERAVDVMRARWPDAQVRVFEDSEDGERQMLEAWRQLVVEMDADVVTDYNGEGYDIPFMWKRALATRAVGFGDMSRLRGWEATLETFTFQSAARGLRVTERVRLPGRAHMDMMLAVKENIKMPSYGLAAVCTNLFAGRKQKEDIPAKLITQLWRKSSAMRGRIASYCMQDARLPLEIMVAKQYLGQYMAVASVCGVTLEALFVRGQGFKGYVQMLAFARSEGSVVSDARPRPRRRNDDDGGDDDDEGYVGAWVHSTVSSEGKSTLGLHDDPLVMLDVMSLYPSKITENNIGPDTYVGTELTTAELRALHGLGEDDVHRTPVGHIFLRRSVRTSVLVTLIEQVLAARRDVKRNMATAYAEGRLTDAAILNAMQLALKISANSMYGLFGAPTSKLYFKPVAESITSSGQECIKEAARITEALMGAADTANALCVYGDSVAGDTPLLIRFRAPNGSVGIEVIEARELWKEMDVRQQRSGAGAGAGAGADGGKEYIDMENAHVRTWTEHGWTPVQRIMRHRSAEPLVRVQTGLGCVDVTPHHSLVRASRTQRDINGDPLLSEVRPVDLQVGQDVLLHAPVFPDVFCKVSKKRLRAGRGSITDAGAYDAGETMYRHCSADFTHNANGPGCVANKRSYCAGILYESWRARRIFYVGFHASWRKHHRLDDASQGLLTGEELAAMDIGVWDPSMRTRPDDNALFDMSCVLHRPTPDDCELFGLPPPGPPRLRSGWLDEPYNGYDFPPHKQTVRYTVCGKLNAQFLFMLMQSLNVVCRIEPVSQQLFDVVIRSGSPPDNEIETHRVLAVAPRPAVPWMYADLPPSDADIDAAGRHYVYDLTTANHHFQAGLGNIIVHNTDSVMVEVRAPPFNDDVRRAWAVGKLMEALVNRHYREMAAAAGANVGSIVFEFEALYYPFLLLNKKRYAACAYEVERACVSDEAEAMADDFARLLPRQASQQQDAAAAYGTVGALAEALRAPTADAAGLRAGLREALLALATMACGPTPAGARVDVRADALWAAGPLAASTHIKMMGIESKRRDNARVLRRTLDAVLHALLVDRAPAAALELARATVEAVVQNTLPWEDYIISKSMSKQLESYDQVRRDSSPHLRVVQLMRERDPTTAPPTGERVPYIMVNKQLKRWSAARRVASAGGSAGGSAGASVDATTLRIHKRLVESGGDVSVLPDVERRRVMRVARGQLLASGGNGGLTPVVDATGAQLVIMPSKSSRALGAEMRTLSPADNAEDPAFALINNMERDADYYLYKQLMKPLLRVLVPVCEPDHMKGMSRAEVAGMTVKQWEATKTYRHLFVGDHMRPRTMRLSNSWGPMAKFVKPSPPCMICSATSTGGGGGGGGGSAAAAPPMCATCRAEGREADARHAVAQRVEQAQQAYEAVMDVCRRCLRNTLEDPDLCMQRECSITVHDDVPDMAVEAAVAQGHTSLRWPVSATDVVDIEDLAQWQTSCAAKEKNKVQRNMFFERVKRKELLRRANALKGEEE